MIQAASMLVTRNFPPLVGGMEAVNRHLLDVLAQRGSAVLCGPKGAREFAPQEVECHESSLRPTARFLAASLMDACVSARRRKPALTIAGSGLTAPHAVLAAHIAGGSSAVYLHGLDVVAEHPAYRMMWLPNIRACDLVIANSNHTHALALAAGVRGERLRILHPGCDLPQKANLDEGAAFRTARGIADAPMLLAVGRLTRRKGLAEFIAKALPRIVAIRPNTMLVVIGGEASDALHQHGASERERIIRTANDVGLGAHVQLLGHCDQANLEAAHAAADCHVFPVLDMPGDVEGFGMVAVEAAAHGLQTVAFASGGVPDAISPGASGILVAPGDHQAFADAVLETIAQERDDASRLRCRGFAESLGWDAFARNLHAILDEAIPGTKP